MPRPDHPTQGKPVHNSRKVSRPRSHTPHGDDGTAPVAPSSLTYLRTYFSLTYFTTSLPQPTEPTPDGAEEPVFELPPIMCTDFKGHMHVPLWITPALFAFVFVACLLGCFNKRRS